jgi:hypothetical protein
MLPLGLHLTMAGCKGKILLFQPSGQHYHTPTNSHIMNTPAFHERHSLAIRVWRMTTTGTFFLLVSTAMASKAVFGSDHISWFIEKFNLQKGIALSPEQLALQLLNLRESILGIHVAMGYLFTILLVLGALASLVTTSARNRSQSAWRTGGLLAFTGMLGTMAATGFWMMFNEDMEIFAPAQFNSMKSMHELAYHSLLVTSMLYAALQLLRKEKKTLQLAFTKFIMRPLSLKKLPC